MNPELSQNRSFEGEPTRESDAREPLSDIRGEAGRENGGATEYGESGLLGMADVSRITGLPRPAVLYLTRLGLVNPVRMPEGPGGVRKFSHDDVDILRNAQVLQEAGTPPREIVALLRPSRGESTLLTETEEKVIRMRYGGKIRRPVETVAEELGLARQTVQEIKENAITKLTRAYLRRQELSRPPRPGSLDELVKLRDHWVERHAGSATGPRCPHCERPSEVVRYEGPNYTMGVPVFRCPEGHEFGTPESLNEIG